MLTIVLWILICAIGMFGTWKWLDRDSDCWTLSAIWGILCGMFCVVTLHFVGLAERYSEGERIGYIVKESRRGIIFKTFEIDVQMGTGQQASLQPAIDMSANDPAIIESIKSKIGKKVRLTYNQWLIQPITKGGSDYEITGVSLMDEAVEKP